MFLPVTTTLAALAAAPSLLTNTAAGLFARSDAACSTDGALVCSSDGTQFGVCNFGQALMQSVNEGTICQCAPANGGCLIAAADLPAPAKTTPAPISAAPSPTAASSTPTPPAPSSTGNGTIGYMTYLGDGSTADGWPAMSGWKTFEEIWNANYANVISLSCGAFPGQANNSPQESQDLHDAILSVSNQFGVDSRFVLAIVLQESGGCVRVPTTTYSVANPGLMQDHSGNHTCYNVNPCPNSEIIGMIQDGVDGTAAGPGLKQLMGQVGDSGAQQYYRTARAYNSGSVPANGLLQDGVATHCYASDVANRLVGVTDVAACPLDAQ